MASAQDALAPRKYLWPGMDPALTGPRDQTAAKQPAQIPHCNHHPPKKAPPSKVTQPLPKPQPTELAQRQSDDPQAIAPVQNQTQAPRLQAPAPAPVPAQVPAQVPAPAPIGGKKRIRPSLSDQLAAISSNTDKLIGGIKESIQRDGGAVKGTPLVLAYCKDFVVGTSRGQFSSPVQFFNDRCTYAFHHSREGRINMDMKYRDMKEYSLDERKMVFKFRIHRNLEHYVTCYDPGRADHVLSMVFSKKPEMISFKAKVLPLIQGDSRR